ncbi:MAG: hypothetical protein JWN48_1699 [Myxococcaceae bacterium]|nr:hypothetical protein [Myxococcaceae bacterium]
MLKRVSLGLTCALLLAPAQLSAQDVAPETLMQSNALFAQGKRALETGQTAAACASFAESFRLLPRGGTLLNLGLCREQEGRASEAWRVLRSALTVAQRDGRSDRVPIAQEHIARLEGRLSFVALSLPHDVDPSWVALRLDGSPISREEWAGVPLEPGEHLLSAEALGFETWSTKLTIGQTPVRLVVPIGPLVARPSPNETPDALRAAAPPTPPSVPASTPSVPASTPPAQAPATSAAGAPPPYPYTAGAPVYYPPLPQEDPAARAARIAERQAAREGWFVEGSLGITASKSSDSYIKTLRAFDYQDAGSARLNIDTALGVMLTRRLGLVFHYDRLERRNYEVSAHGKPAQEYAFSWHTQAVMAGLRLRQPILSHWLVVFTDLTAGLAFTTSELEYPVSVGSTFAPKHDQDRDRSLSLRGIAGFQFGFTRHVGAFVAGGYAYAPTLTNLAGERHDSGGPVFLTGVRLNSVKGWW